jgi:subtilisin family serine protease
MIKRFLIGLALGYLVGQMAFASCNEGPVIIAVLDTGFGYHNKGHEAALCKYGHKDFTIEKYFLNSYDTVHPIPMDTNGHGTNVIGVIEQELLESNISYCIVVLKTFSALQSGDQNVLSSIRAFDYVNAIKPHIVNYSGGGYNSDVAEMYAVKSYLDKGGVLVAAAGNDSENLEQRPHYPGQYDKRVVLVGNLEQDGKKAKSSNYGKSVSRWEIGTELTGYGVTSSGTSQATARATGKIVASGTLGDNINRCPK